MERGKRKLKTGVVVSNKMDKTAVVLVERKYLHPLYSKVIRASNKFKAHDEKNECQIGDLVEIAETRPISRDKCWRIVKILGKAKLRARDYPKVKKVEENKVDTAAQ